MTSNTTTTTTTLAYRTESAKPTEASKQARIEFFAARDVALSTLRATAQSRLDALQHDIRGIIAACEANEVTDIEATLAGLARMGKTEQKLVDDVARLTSKISKS